MTAERVQLEFSGLIDGMRFLRSRIVTKASNLFVNTYPSAKLFRVFTEMHAKKSSFVPTAQFMLILVVFGSRCFSEIVKSVIRSVSVCVVNVPTWKASVDIQKSEAVRSIGFVINPNCDVPLAMKMPSYFANLDAKGRGFEPTEQSSLRAIMQNFAQSFGGNVCRIFSSHDAPPVRWDQRRGRVDSACLASSLYHVKNALLRLEAIEVEGK